MNTLMRANLRKKESLKWKKLILCDKKVFSLERLTESSLTYVIKYDSCRYLCLMKIKPND